LQVSRPTVRAALRRLSEEGLIRARHGIGWEIVARPTRSVPAARLEAIGLLSFVPLDQAPPLHCSSLINSSITRHAGWKVEVTRAPSMFMQNHRPGTDGTDEDEPSRSPGDVWRETPALMNGFRIAASRDSASATRRRHSLPLARLGSARGLRHAAGLLMARGHRHFVCLLPRYMHSATRRRRKDFAKA